MKWFVLLITVVAGIALGTVPASASTCAYVEWGGVGTQVCTP
jgi:uncharacterized membrane protein